MKSRVLVGALALALPLAASAQSLTPACEAAMKTATPKVKLSTSMGPIVIQLEKDKAPISAANFVKYVSMGHYDGVVFHRVIPGFMAQGGDPTGTGSGGSSKPNLNAEFSDAPHVRGVCSMARTNDPNSANSQFFICFDDARFLDGKYTVWGEVTEGMENVDALPKGEPPRNPGKIVTARAE